MMNKIISLSNVLISDDFHEKTLLKNVNISFNEGQNVCFYSSTNNEFYTCQKFISVLAGASKIESGNIVYSKFDNNDRKYIFGFNNFSNILTKNVKAIDVIEALLNKEKISKSNENEIFEVIRFLNLDLYMQDNLCDLSDSQKTLFNLIFLFIIKPRILFIDNLPLFGPPNSQIAILKFIKEYLKKYHITLFISTNDFDVRKELCQRYVEINNGMIVNDREIYIKETTNNNEIDNKTKVFDLDTELDFSLNSSIATKPQFRENNNTYPEQRKPHIEPINNPYIKNNIDISGTDTDSLSRDFDDTLSKRHHTSDLNRSLNVAFNKNHDSIKNRTMELKFDSEDLIEEIKLKSNNKQIPQPQQKFVSNIYKNKEIQANIDNEIVQDLVDTYLIKKQLEHQIKSPDFIKLSVDLQHKVFDNYERADKLIRENDPTGKYDPNRTSNLKVSTTKKQQTQSSQNYGFTKMILSEDLGLDNENNSPDKRIENIYKSKTSEFDLEENFNYDTHNAKFNHYFKNNTKPSRYYEEDKYRHPMRDKHVSEENFEPTRNITEKISYHANSSVNFSNGERLSNSNYKDSYSEPKQKVIKTKAIKTRVKKNKIEQLYEEALADQELAHDLKEKS